MFYSTDRPALVAATLVIATFTAVAPARADAARSFGDDYIAFGEAVEVRELVSGDALLAGGTVESNASIGGDATMAGGEVTVRATVGDNLYAAGGQVEVDALISGNARIAGGKVRIAPETRIEGAASIAGGSVNVDGSFGRYLTVAGGDVTLGGTVAGDVHVYAGELTVLPGTRIGGQLLYRTKNPAVIPPGVEIRGGALRENEGRTRDKDRKPGAWSARGPVWSVAWLWLAGLFAVGLLLALALASFSHKTTRILEARPWLALGIGFLVLVCVPAIGVALVITLIGIPLALILMFVYFAMLIAAYVIGALFLGDRALAAARPAAPVTAGWRLLALFLTLVVLGVVSSIPVIGDVVRLAVLLLGLGGITLAVIGSSAAPPAVPEV